MVSDNVKETSPGDAEQQAKRAGAIPFLLTSKSYITGNPADGFITLATCRTLVSC
jgi:hypothetical protein